MIWIIPYVVMSALICLLLLWADENPVTGEDVLVSLLLGWVVLPLVLIHWFSGVVLSYKETE